MWIFRLLICGSLFSNIDSISSIALSHASFNFNFANLLPLSLMMFIQCVLSVFACDHAIVLVACLQTGTWDLVLAWLYRDRVLAPINIYKESNSVDVGSRYHPDVPKTDLNSWHTLGPRAERNKENNAIPTKWTTYKVSSLFLPQYTIDKDWHFDIFTEPTITLVYLFQIPQRPGSRTRGAGASSTCIEVFVDEECEEWVQWQVSLSLAASFLWNFVIFENLLSHLGTVFQNT